MTQTNERIHLTDGERIGRWIVSGHLGSGGMGAVYRAIDDAGGPEIALKIAPVGPGIDPKQEFATLAGLDHPGIVKVRDIDAAEIDGSPVALIAMDLVQGQPVDELLNAEEEPDALMDAARQLLEALAYLHARHIAHGDIKPANVLARRSDEGIVLTLVDFGLAGAAAQRSGGYAGTPRYSAPELFEGMPPNALSDLFAAGVLLFELAAGYSPFAGDSTAQQISALLAGEHKDILEHAPFAPLGMDELIEGLMAHSPSARLQSADEALTILAECMGTEYEAQQQAQQRLVAHPPLSGRQTITDHIYRRIREATDSAPCAVFLPGDSGSGKSRILRDVELQLALRQHGRIVCDMQDSASATPPLQRAIAAHIRSRAGRFASIISRFGPGVQHFAGLGQAKDEQDTAEAAQSRRFVFSEVARLLSDLSSAEPVTFLIDNLEAMGPGDMELLQALAFTRFRGSISMVMTGSTAQLPATTADFLARLSHRGLLTEESLEPLDENGIAALTKGVLGEGDWSALALRLYEISGGMPGVCIATLEQCAENGLLLRRRGGWDHAPDFDPQRDHIPAAPDHREAALQRAGEYSSHLLLAALTPPPVDAKVFATAAVRLDLTPKQPALALKALAAAGLLRPGDDGYVFVQPALATLLVQGMDASQKHLVAAMLLHLLQSSGQGLAAARVALHTVDNTKVIPLLGEQSRMAFAAGDTEQAQQLASALLERATDDPQWTQERAAARRIAAESLLRLGRASEAAKLLEPVMELDPQPAHRVLLLEALRMNSAHRRGADFARTTQTAGYFTDSDYDKHPALWLRWYYAARWCHMLTGGKQDVLQDVTTLLKQLAAQLDDASRARLLILAGTAAWMCNEPDMANDFLGQSRGLFQRLGDLKGLGDACNGLATVSLRRGDFDSARGLYQKALNYFKDVGNFDAITRGFNNLASAFYMQGNWEEAGKLWEVFLSHCRQSGNITEQLRAYNNLGFLYLNTGQLARSRRHLEEGLKLAEHVGNQGVRLTLLSNLGEILALQGEESAARSCYDTCEELCETLDAKGERLELLHRQASLELSGGRHQAAREYIDTLTHQAQELGAVAETAWARRLEALLHMEDNPHQAADLAAQSVALFSEAGEPFEEAKSRGVLARALFAEGATRQARQELDAARERFIAFGARGELEELGRISASVGRQTGWRDAAAEGSVLVDTVRNLISERDTDRLLGRVLSHALDATGAGRGAILIRDPKNKHLVLRAARDISGRLLPGEEMAVSSTAVNQVFESGEALAVVNVDDADGELRGSESILDLNLRSLLVVPLDGLEDRLGVLYLDSEHLGETRMTATLSLLEALGSVASVAIETAMLLEERQQRQEELGVIAHELRAPLHGIRGMAGLMLGNDTLPEDLTSKAQTIVGQADRMARMVKDVLQASLLDPGATGAATPLQPVAMAPVLGEVADMVAAAQPEGSARIRLKAKQDVNILGMRDRLVQAVTNLLTNALKYSPEGAAVDLSLKKASKTLLTAAGIKNEDPGAWLAVEVADRGDGIDDEAKKNIFQRYVRLEDGRLKASGAGLGLYITHRIVQQHGGHIVVLDRKGGGSRFCMLLPRGE